MSLIQVDVKDMSPEVLAEFKRKVALALAVVGEAAEGYAKEDCPVDTGRLRNSITYKTENAQGTPNTGGGQPAGPDDYRAKAQPEENAVYIGTNVEYAPIQEYNDMYHKVGRAHFLRDAATTHGDEYEAKVDAVMRS